MLAFALQHFRSLLLLLTGLLGIALGQLAATGIGALLSPPVTLPADTAPDKPAITKKPVLEDYQPILNRNLFNSAARNQLSFIAPEATGTGAAPAPARSDLTLLGTVVGGRDSMAVVRSGGEVKILRPDEELPGGVKVAKISRNALTLVYSGGREETLYLYIEGSAEAPAAAPATPPAAAPVGGEPSSSAIRSVGPNRWVVASEAVEKARGNMGELLKQARLEPVVVGGQTQGFTVRMIQPRSLFALLGLQRGDVIRQVNGVELDSPEKALQIFQQLREARNITIGLVRNGTAQNFSYEIK